MIRVEMVCNECGGVHSVDSSRESSKSAIVIYEHAKYFCTECGKEMSLRVVKSETTETETIIS